MGRWEWNLINEAHTYRKYVEPTYSSWPAGGNYGGSIKHCLK